MGWWRKGTTMGGEVPGLGGIGSGLIGSNIYNPNLHLLPANPANLQNQTYAQQAESLQSRISNIGAQVHNQSFDPSITDPGYQLSLTACAQMWETRFGDNWVEQGGVAIPADYAAVLHRMSKRNWFEHARTKEGGFIRLLPEELRK